MDWIALAVTAFLAADRAALNEGTRMAINSEMTKTTVNSSTSVNADRRLDRLRVRFSGAGSGFVMVATPLCREVPIAKQALG
jgi:hypothetical protein